MRKKPTFLTALAVTMGVIAGAVLGILVVSMAIAVIVGQFNGVQPADAIKWLFEWIGGQLGGYV